MKKENDLQDGVQRARVYIIESGSYIKDVLSSEPGQQRELVSLSSEEELVGALGKKLSVPSVVVLDATDEKLSGLLLLEMMNAKNRSDLSVIVVSHSGKPVNIDEALRLGAEDYIIKEQFTQNELIAKIKRAERKLAIIANEPMETSTQEGTSSIDATNTHVLIVEDDQFLRELSSRKLKQEGFHVDVAIDGNEGMKKIEDQKPEVILLDIILPGIDGFDILQRVRSHANERVRESIIILLSNLGQEADVTKGERLGADDYLIKANFTIDEIIEKIKNALAKKKKPSV